MKKYLYYLLLALFISAVLPPVRVWAAGSDGFRLDEKGTVTVVSQHAAQEGVSSLCFSLSVESAEAAAAEFQFIENTAEILEYRYDKDTHKLNVYVAGTEALFADGADSLTIGRVVARDESGRETEARVSVVEDSLQYVYGTELKTMENIDLPGTVQIGVTSGTAPVVPPAVTPVPEEPDDPEEDPQTQTQPSAASPTRPPVQASGTVTRPQATQAPSHPQNTGSASGSAGNHSQTTGSVSRPSESVPQPSVSSLPESTPDKDADGFIYSKSPDETDTEHTTGSKRSNALFVIAGIVIVVVVIVEIVAFVVIKKKPKNK